MTSIYKLRNDQDEELQRGLYENGSFIIRINQIIDELYENLETLMKIVNYSKYAIIFLMTTNIGLMITVFKIARMV